MKLRTFKQTLLACTLSLCGQAMAMPLSDYNLILAGDYVYKGGEVEGATLIGGKLDASGHSPTFGTRTVPVFNSVSVVGDIEAANLNINDGNLLYAGNLSVGNINMNGGGDVIYDPTFNIDGIISDLFAASSSYSGLSSNGTFNNGVLSYAGSEALAVFDLAYNEVFAQNTTLKLDFGTADQVVINVRGDKVDVGGGVNITEGFRDLGAENIIWNFSDASLVDFNSICMYGAVLAIGADISGGCVFDGGVAANSYVGYAEFHQFLVPPSDTPPTEVPAPGPFALLAIAGSLIFTRRWLQTHI